MKPVNPKLLKHAQAARSYLIVTVILGLAVTGLILTQAALLAHELAAAALGTGARALAPALVLLLGVVVARAAATYGGEAAALRAAARVKSQLRRKLIGHCLRLGPAWLGGQRPGADRRPGDPGPGRAGSVLRAVPAAAGAVGPGPGGRGGDGDRHRLDLRRGDRGHAAADPAVRRPGRPAHQGADPPPVAAAGPAGRPFPGCRAGPADAQGVRAGQVPGTGDRQRHRRAPVGGHGDAARRVPVRAGPGAVRGPGHGPGRGRDRAAAAVRTHAVPGRAAGPAAHPGGVPAAAGGRRPVSRQRGGHRRRREHLRHPGHSPDAADRPGHGLADRRHGIGSRPALGHDTTEPGDRGLPGPGPARPGPAEPDHRPRRADHAHRTQRSRENHRCCSCSCSSSSRPREPPASAEPTWPPSRPSSWRAQIAWVPQHPRLFGGSVADNIALGQPGATRARHRGRRQAGRCGRVHRGAPARL